MNSTHEPPHPPTHEAAKHALERIITVGRNATTPEDKQLLGFAAGFIQTLIASHILDREEKQ